MSSAWLSGVAVAFGAVFGAVIRWAVGLWLNPMWMGFPLGTLAVNVFGGFMAGVAFVVFERTPNEPLRLLFVVGGLGGLTTFSSFSVESLSLIEDGRFAMVLAHLFSHVLGVLACAALGAKLARWWLA